MNGVSKAGRHGVEGFGDIDNPAFLVCFTVEAVDVAKAAGEDDGVGSYGGDAS